MRDAWLKRVAERGFNRGHCGASSAKLADLAGRVERIRRHTKASVPELAGDQDSFELVSFEALESAHHETR